MSRGRIILGLAGLVIAGALVALWPRGPRPCRDTFEQVHEGMTRQEVIATLGAPPGAYTRRPGWVPYFDRTYGMDEVWLAEGGELRVYFDGADRAFLVEVHDLPPDTRPFIRRVTDSAGLTNWLGL